MASVKVAVRVRPFNQRELDMGAKLIIQMDGKKTRIKQTSHTKDSDGKDRYKDFTFDHSYWSFESSDPHYASQEQVFSDLGTEVVDCAFEGYNACVFAYGQTGSGKTYTMMGSGECQGLIPRICKTLFSRMQMGKEQGASYHTEVSYLEIYNERVKDLLRAGSSTGHSLRVREHPRHGPYVQDLSRHLVTDYSDIQELMIQGNNQRTTASTNMNDVSSRSHAIFTITFIQAGFSNDMPSETKSKVHLVDLAGSERADTSGATGQRLKEGAHINKSLVTLGSVISALAELSNNNKSQHSVFIPYRDSVLTWLLKDSLGGNSKTIMIAAISPADCNHSETLSTLRYANRAKNIINKPTINEDPNVKLIRELREEISMLKSLILSENTEKNQPQVLAELHQKEAQEKVLTEEWTEKWKETQKILQEQKALGLRKSGLGVVLDSDMPHLVGIDDDVLSTGVTLYHLKEGETRIGTEEASVKQDIILNGNGLEAEHCRIILEGGAATLVPNDQAQCWVNTVHVDKPTRLSQGCIILLGRTNMFRYNDPIEAAKLRKEGSRSLMNLSRLSLLSWSTPDLALSTENLNNSSEDPELLEELELQRITLQKEKEAFKKEQAEKERDWEAEQKQRKEALEAAQKELEAERQHMELEYTIQCRRLAEDWQRLEKQQQESLAALKQRESELHKRLEMLQWERSEEMAQIDSENRLLAELKCELDAKRRHFVQFISENLQNSLRRKSCPNGFNISQQMNGMDPYYQNTDSSSESWASLSNEAVPRHQVLRELVDSHRRDLAAMEAEVESRMQAVAEHRLKVNQIDRALEDVNTCLQADTAEFEAMRRTLANRTREQLLEIMQRKKSLSLDLKNLNTVELPTCDEESNDLGPFISDQTFSSSLGTGDTFHTAVSPCSPVNGSAHQQGPLSDSGVETEGDKLMNYDDSDDISSTEDCCKKTPCKSSSSFERVSPSEIHATSHTMKKTYSHSNWSSPMQPLSVAEAMRTMKQLFQQVTDQKLLIMESLENDCDKSELNKQIALLQELQRQYIRLELALEHHPLRPLRMDSTLSSEESDDMSTSADDGLSDIPKHEIARFRESSRRSSEVVPGGLISPFSPTIYPSSRDEESMSASSLSLVSPTAGVCIQIPSYVLRGAGSSTHYEYEVKVTVGGERWTLLRRYKRFRELHICMKQRYGPSVEAIPFPPRQFFSKTSESLAQQRRKQLESYLQQLLDTCMTIPSCPLYTCRQHPTKLALLEFSAFFRKGVFESGKYGTS